jgi:hypothetical protein
LPVPVHHRTTKEEPVIVYFVLGIVVGALC